MVTVSNFRLFCIYQKLTYFRLCPVTFKYIQSLLISLDCNTVLMILDQQQSHFRERFYFSRQALYGFWYYCTLTQLIYHDINILQLERRENWLASSHSLVVSKFRSHGKLERRRKRRQRKKKSLC